ncbi:hypothetical protein FDECE_2532 [Fusarium decemcellulare]|nr:hypothetical protein FDECE_2532 [Fusarium decemcellulare]
MYPASTSSSRGSSLKGREKLKSEMEEVAWGSEGSYVERSNEGGRTTSTVVARMRATERMQAGPMASSCYKGGVDGGEPLLGDSAAQVSVLGRVVLMSSSSTTKNTTRRGGGWSGTWTRGIGDEVERDRNGGLLAAGLK